MLQELQTIIQEVSAIARKHNWSTILEITASAKQASPALLIVAPDDCDTSEFQNWLKEMGSGLTITLEPLRTLTQKPSMVLAFDKVIVVFTSGVLIKGEAATIVQTSILTRPAGSYAIVMSGARNIQAEDDLAIIERGIRRLFLSYLLPDTAPQQNISQLLQEHNIYLWDRETSNADLQDRLQQDSAMLSNWLITAVNAATRINLDIQYVQTLLKQTELALEQEQQKQRRAHVATDQSDQFQSARREIGTLRGQIRQLIQDRTKLVRNNVKTSLETLQDELLGNLSTEIRRQYSGNRQGSIDLNPYIMQGLRRWQREREKKLFLDMENTTTNDIKELVQDMDRVWRLVNEELNVKSSGKMYPTALIDLLQQRTVQTAASITQNSRVSLSGRTRPGVRAGELVGAIVGMGIGWILGPEALPLRIPLVALGGLGGAVLSGLLPTQRRPEQLVQIEAQCRPVIRGAMSQVIEKALENVQRYANESLEALDKALEGIENQLDVKVRETMRGNNVSDPFASTIATLQSCQQRLSIIVQVNAQTK